MRISNLHLIICAATLFGGIVIVRADDNPAQAAARAALEEKMQELNAQPAPANVQAPAPAKQKQPVQNPPAAAPAAPVAVTPSGATMQKPANPPAAPVQKTKHNSTTSNSDHGLFAPVPPPSGSAPVATEPGQGTQSSMAVQTPPSAPASQPVFTTPPKNSGASNAGSDMGFKPIVAPPLPISPMQQAELQSLLDKYDANAISPEQYQAERAKILKQHK